MGKNYSQFDEHHGLCDIKLYLSAKRTKKKTILLTQNIVHASAIPVSFFTHNWLIKNWN